MQSALRHSANRFNAGSSSQYWTQTLINTDCLFYASDNSDLLNKVAATHLPNQVTGAVDFLTVTGTGLNARYRTPDSDTYRTADSDFIFWKSDASESTCDGNRLIAYDFPRILVKYLNVAPYTILAIAILKPGVTVTNGMRDAFDLSIWWDGTWNDNGYMKQNRPLSMRYVWTAESTVPVSITDANLKGRYNVSDLTKITKNGSNVCSQWRCLYGVGPNINLNWGTPHYRSTGIYSNSANNDFMFSAAFATVGRNQPEMIYAIFKILSSTPSSRLMDSNFTDRAALFESATVPGDLAIYANGAVVSAYTNASVGSWHVLRILFNAASSKLIIDDGAPVSGNIGVGGGTVLALFGRGNGSLPSNIEFNDILLRNGTDAANETEIYNYFKGLKNAL
jgi:hypothetical protein